MGTVTRCQLQVYGVDFNAVTFAEKIGGNGSIFYEKKFNPNNRLVRWHSNWEYFKNKDFFNIDEQYRQDFFLMYFLSKFKNIKNLLNAESIGKTHVLLVVEFSAKFSHPQRGIHLQKDLIHLLEEIGCSLSWSASCSRKWMPMTSKAGFRASYKEILIKCEREKICQN